ncbi:Hsp20/alpha crystallin family protein [Candidatus Parcubacteria bacterium]|nr:Hsp20/alpha crystallin family protein [Candidatus Parcubacteria bacterium]
MRKIFNKLIGTNNNKLEEEEYEEEYEDEEEGKEEDGDEKDWLDEEYHEEGQLSIDVYQNDKELIIKSTIAGVKSDNVDISINEDMLTIRGYREMNEEIADNDYLFRECYWGAFSRSIILPVEVETNKIDATLENGILTVVLPKAKVKNQVKIKVKEKRS